MSPWHNDDHVIFNAGGNNDRIYTAIRFASQTTFIKRVMTHAEYDAWNRKGKPQ